jgi:hypothetical protein
MDETYKAREEDRLGMGSNRATQENLVDGGAMVNASQAEPGVTIGLSALLAAISSAERAVYDILIQIRELEAVRDGHVREAGKVQSKLDELHQQREGLSRHVRDLTAARS